jgi:hypothetical protein
MTIAYKSGHNNSRHIDEKQLDETESKYFIEFLEAEIQRHKEEIIKCDYLMRFFRLVKVKEVAYASSILGHREDIEATQLTVDYLKEKWRN